MESPVLTVRNVGKRFEYDLGSSRRAGFRDILRELTPLRRPAKKPESGREILSGISFTLNRGEALALIGRNGSGKTSLLRMIAGLIKPDSGQIERRGSLSSVIGLGAGLDDLLTGRENARLLLTWQGCANVDDSITATYEFSELGQMFDAPVQHYSTGMRARLAYAIAAQLKADLLLVDEALSVGDAAFQRKCMRHIKSHLEQGGALLFVSHSAQLVLETCNRALLLDDARITYQGDVSTALKLNRESKSAEEVTPLETDTQLDVKRDKLQVVMLEDHRNHFTLGVDVFLDEPRNIACALAFWSVKHARCIAGSVTSEPMRLSAGKARLRYRLDRPPFVPGHYRVGARLMDAETGERIAQTRLTESHADLFLSDGESMNSSAENMFQAPLSLTGHWSEDQNNVT